MSCRSSKGGRSNFCLLISGAQAVRGVRRPTRSGNSAGDVGFGPRFRFAIVALPARSQLGSSALKTLCASQRKWTGRTSASCSISATGCGWTKAATTDRCSKRPCPACGRFRSNGADVQDDQPSWQHYIQPLDRGSFDLCSFLKVLDELGYKGPVGLQCYGIGGDAREHLGSLDGRLAKIKKVPGLKR